MSVIDPATLQLARQTINTARERRVMIATAESCTGGLVSTLLTEVPGSSDVFERGFVTYSNRAKQELLGVPFDLLDRYGAVSEEVARAMAAGALERSAAQLAIAITGVAGPGGGTAEKPVGLVHIAIRRNDGSSRHRECRFGFQERGDIRRESARAALFLVLDLLDEAV